MNCHECKFRGSVPGSVHSSCSLVGGIKEQLTMLAVITSGHRAVLTDKATGKSEPLIELDPHGLKKGWANWPLDFDPIWVKSCMGYTPKTES